MSSIHEITIPIKEIDNNIKRYDALYKSPQYLEYVQDWLDRLYHLALDNKEVRTNVKYNPQ